MILYKWFQVWSSSRLSYFFLMLLFLKFKNLILKLCCPYLKLLLHLLSRIDHQEVSVFLNPLITRGHDGGWLHHQSVWELSYCYLNYLNHFLFLARRNRPILVICLFVCYFRMLASKLVKIWKYYDLDQFSCLPEHSRLILMIFLFVCYLRMLVIDWKKIWSDFDQDKSFHSP